MSAAIAIGLAWIGVCALFVFLTWKNGGGRG